MATAGDIKPLIGIAASDTTRDDEITALIPVLLAQMEQYTQRALSSAVATETVTPTGKTLQLARFPITAITSVTDDQAESLVAASGYSANMNVAILRRLPLGTSWVNACDGSETITVVYTGGPTSTDPAVLGALATWISELLTNPSGFKSEKEGDYSYTKADTASGIPASVETMIRHLRVAI